MYTRTERERDALNYAMVTIVMPALQRAIEDAGRITVYELEGFHPDPSYLANIELAQDEIAARLTEYFAGIAYKQEVGLFKQITTSDLQEWLDRKRRTSEMMAVAG